MAAALLVTSTVVRSPSVCSSSLLRLYVRFEDFEMGGFLVEDGSYLDARFLTIFAVVDL